MSPPVVLHLNPCHPGEKRNLGGKLEGLIWIDEESAVLHVELRGYVESVLNPPKHKQHRLNLTSKDFTKRAVFDTTSAHLSGKKEVTFSLTLPNEAVSFEGVEVFPPATLLDDEHVKIEWKVEAVAGDEVVAWAAFVFAPLPREPEALLPSDGEIGEDNGEVSKRLHLRSHILKRSLGHLTASINLPPSHVYNRDNPALKFKLTLDHVKADGFTIKKNPSAYVYGIETSLWMRTTYDLEPTQKDPPDTTELRRQITPLQIELTPDEEAKNYDIFFDLQATSGGEMPTRKLAPSFQLPDVKREYYLLFEVSPKHNTREKVAEIPIVLIAGELEQPTTSIEGHQKGVPIYA